jgi:DNA/RNA-binding domain of Phe-tRNA-synthetase-like protein
VVDITARAAPRLDDAVGKTVQLSREDEPGQLPDASREVTDRTHDDIASDRVAEAYRQLFWSFDVDPTKRRPAGEALARRAADAALPSIHPLVDALNLASAATLVPFSAFDQNEIQGELRLDLADEDEPFHPIGENETLLYGDHPVWRDDEGVVSLACYRDGQRTALDDDTDRAIVVALGPAALATRVFPDAFRRLESYAKIAGWRFEEPVADLTS